MLAGKVPFQGADPIQTVFMHLSEPAPPIPGLEPALMAVFLRMLAKDAADRYPDVETAWRELEPRLR